MRCAAVANSIGHMEAGAERPAARSRSAHEEMSVGELVRKNRPHRLVRDLSKVLVATLASAGFFVTNSDAWGIADQLATPLLLVIALLAISGLGVWLVVAHSLWEKPSESDNPEFTRRANAATVLTLLIGLLFGYLVLYVAVLASLALVVPDGYMTSSLGHSTDFSDYAATAWFCASMATVVGAIGSGLETDDEVRDTISRYRPDRSDESR